jgi:hypothetical protein
MSRVIVSVSGFGRNNLQSCAPEGACAQGVERETSFATRDLARLCICRFQMNKPCIYIYITEFIVLFLAVQEKKNCGDSTS